MNGLGSLNFATTPAKVPVVNILTETEAAASRLPACEGSLLRAKVATLLEKPVTPKSNISVQEREALRNLRRDDSIQILPADKGRCTVILDKEEYHQKCVTILSDTKTYKTLGKRNPTHGYKTELVKILTRIQTEGQIDQRGYFSVYPTTETPPKFYGLPKIHKEGRPLRPIVSSCGSITYPSSKLLSKILGPLVGKTSHHVLNSKQFVNKVKDERIEEDEIIVSHDVVALFTSVPVDRATAIIHQRLLTDPTLTERTKISVDNIVSLLSFVLNTTYFVYNGVYYKQIHGAAMGSPVSPIVCNLFMEDLEQRALDTALHPPFWWYRYVDDTHSKHKIKDVEEFTQHLNSLDEDIKFTRESPDPSSGDLAFLDSLTGITSETDRRIKVKVYRKPTHTDQYLNFYSNHPIQHKLGVIRTLYDRAVAVVTDPTDREAELDYVDNALRRCDYPDWALKQARDKLYARAQPPAELPTTAPPESSERTRPRIRVSLPYIEGLSDKLRRIFITAGVSVSIKPENKLRSILVHPKDKSEKGDITGSVYHIPCEGSAQDCQSFYIGETERSLWTRFLEHKRPSSVNSSEVARHLHVDSPGHSLDFTNTKVLDRDQRWLERGIKEAVYIRAHKPTLNASPGRYLLPTVWNRVISSHIAVELVTPQ